MPKVRMYCTRVCSYCQMAMRLLEKRGIAFEKIYVDNLPERRVEMVKLTGRITVPQIFIGDTHVGGYHELARLDLAGGLDDLAQPAQSS